MDYSTLQRKDLVQICEARGLATYGNRDLVLARLQRADAEAVPQPPKEPHHMVNVIAGPDTGKDGDPGDDLLNAVQPTQPDPPAAAAPQPSTVDPRDHIIRDMQAELARLARIVEAGAAAVPSGPAEVASAEAIARAAQGEQVFRTEFVLLDGVELGEGLHASLMAQTAAQAVAAGYRTRGGARRYGWGQDAHGQRTALYEIYARK